MTLFIQNEDDDTGEGGADLAYPARYAENQRKLANLIDEIKNKVSGVIICKTFLVRKSDKSYFSLWNVEIQ